MAAYPDPAAAKQANFNVYVDGKATAPPDDTKVRRTEVHAFNDEIIDTIFREITHDEITTRDTPDAHPIASITSLQTELDARESLSNKAAANGYAPLGADTKVPSEYLPPAMGGGFVDEQRTLTALEISNRSVTLATEVTDAASCYTVAFGTNYYTAVFTPGTAGTATASWPAGTPGDGSLGGELVEGDIVVFYLK